jgi:hypothetical protein
MELKEKLNSALQQHGIDENREMIIQTTKGEWYYIPLHRLIEIVSNLYRAQQQIIELKLKEVESNVNLLMEFMYYLAKPLAKVRI